MCSKPIIDKFLTGNQKSRPRPPAHQLQQYNNHFLFKTRLKCAHQVSNQKYEHDPILSTAYLNLQQVIEHLRLGLDDLGCIQHRRLLHAEVVGEECVEAIAHVQHLGRRALLLHQLTMRGQVRFLIL